MSGCFNVDTTNGRDINCKVGVSVSGFYFDR